MTRTNCFKTCTRICWSSLDSLDRKRGHSCSGYSLLVLPVSLKKHSFLAGLCPATHQQKLLSTPWSGARKASLPTCLPVRRIAFFTDTGMNDMPDFPNNIVPTNIAWLKISGKFPMGLRIPPRNIKIVLESSPLKSTMSVGRLGVWMIAYIYRYIYVYIFIYLSIYVYINK